MRVKIVGGIILAIALMLFAVTGCGGSKEVHEVDIGSHEVTVPYPGKVVVDADGKLTLYVYLPDDAREIQLHIEWSHYNSAYYVTFTDVMGAAHIRFLSSEDWVIELNGRVETKRIWEMDNVIACPGKCKVE